MNQNHSKDIRSFNYNPVGRAHSTLSVSAIDCYMNLPVNRTPSPALSTVTLTPGRIRNIDQDMEALRASRQDNPFLQHVIASRESLADSLDDSESDHTNLMSHTKLKSPKSEIKPKHISWDGTECTSPLKVLPRPHALHHDRFSLLTASALRSSGEDSVRLMSSED
uniref:Uncharacterized protein n=1 Tax=Photinus pyralis TaxID=7054 RepID=A0A1Y1KLZ8_PHOPY